NGHLPVVGARKRRRARRIRSVGSMKKHGIPTARLLSLLPDVPSCPSREKPAHPPRIRCEVWHSAGPAPLPVQMARPELAPEPVALGSGAEDVSGVTPPEWLTAVGAIDHRQLLPLADRLLTVDLEQH